MAASAPPTINVFTDLARRQKRQEYQNGGGQSHHTLCFQKACWWRHILDTIYDNHL